MLAPRRVSWAEKPGADVPMAFRKYTEPDRGEKIILVDDILRSGLLLAEAKALIEQYGAEVLAMAVIASSLTRRRSASGRCPSTHWWNSSRGCMSTGLRANCAGRVSPQRRSGTPGKATRLRQRPRLFSRRRGKRIDRRRVICLVGGDGILLLQDKPKLVDAFQQAVFRKPVHREFNRPAVGKA